jgi:hypothetical protein
VLLLLLLLVVAEQAAPSVQHLALQVYFEAPAPNC